MEKRVRLYDGNPRRDRERMEDMTEQERKEERNDATIRHHTEETIGKTIFPTEEAARERLKEVQNER